jgi:hypothetical protein
LQKLLTLVKQEQWLEDNDGKFNTWQEMFAGVMRSKVLKDVYFSWCLAATESVNAKGYAVYYMYLPENREAAIPFALEGDLVTQFNAAVHIKKDNRITQESNALNEGIDEDDEFATDADAEDPFDTSGDDELFDLED